MNTPRPVTLIWSILNNSHDTDEILDSTMLIACWHSHLADENSDHVSGRISKLKPICCFVRGQILAPEIKYRNSLHLNHTLN